MPGAAWFPGATLNYAEHAVGGPEPTTVAVLGYSQTRDRVELTWGQLRDQVARARAGLQRLGVGRGDRVVAYLPNIPETLVAFLATASLGAVWASCAPEFGAHSVVDRFGQIEPKVLLAVAGYGYGSKDVDRREQVAEIRAGLPTVEHVVHVPYGENTLPDSTPWSDLLAGAGRSRVRPGPVRPPAVRAVLLRHHRQAEGDRAQPRRDPAGAPEEPRAELGPRAGRPDPVVLHHRLDDVERAGVVAAGARVDRDDRRQPAAPGHPLAVAAGRRDRRDADGRESRLPHGVPQGGCGAGEGVRPVAAAADRGGGQPAAAGGLPVGGRAVRAGRAAQRGQRRHGRLLRDRAGQPAAAGVVGGDLRAVPGGRREGVRRRRQAGRRRPGRAGDHRADAVDAGRVLGRRRRHAATATPTSTPGPASGATATGCGSPRWAAPSSPAARTPR